MCVCVCVCVGGRDGEGHCVCVCVCVSVCMCALVCSNMRVRVYMPASTGMHACVYMCVHSCVLVSVCLHVRSLLVQHKFKVFSGKDLFYFQLSSPSGLQQQSKTGIHLSFNLLAEQLIDEGREEA